MNRIRFGTLFVLGVVLRHKVGWCFEVVWRSSVEYLIGRCTAAAGMTRRDIGDQVRPTHRVVNVLRAVTQRAAGVIPKA